MPDQTENEIEIFSSENPSEVEPVFKLLLENGIACRVVTPNSDYSPYFSKSVAADSRAKIVVQIEDQPAAIQVLKQFQNDDDFLLVESFRAELQDLDSIDLLEILSSHSKYPQAKVEMAGIILEERDADIEPIEAEKTPVDETEMMKPLKMTWIGFVLLLIFGMSGIGIAAFLVILFYRGETPSGKKYPFYSMEVKWATAVIMAFSMVLWTLILVSLRY